MRRLGSDPLEPAGAADPLRRELSDRGDDIGCGRREPVVIARLEPHHPGRRRGPEADRKPGPERDRHLAEDLARKPLADDAVEPVGVLDGVDLPGEDGEEGLLVSLVNGVFPRRELDVGRRACKLLPLVGGEPCEERNLGEIFGGHHRRGSSRTRCAEENGRARIPR